VALFLIAGVLSLVFGTLLVAFRVGPVPVLSRAIAVYVTLVRNTPLLIVLIFFRIAGPKIGIQFNFVDVRIGDIRLNNLFAACVVGLTVYTSVFVCEAIRSGVNAVSLGQAEAARAIGLPFAGVMREVVLPQAFRASVPPLASVQIALLKNTTVAGALGVFEAFARMRGLTNDYATQRIGIFLTFALVFVVLVEIVSFAANRFERRWRIAR
jgi:glutamate transport system permease protein